jgi:hypothetical protein
LRHVRIHKALKMSPAMASGVETRLWEMADLAKITDDYVAEKSNQEKDNG